MNLPYLVTRRRLAGYRTAVLADLARKLDRSGDGISCTHRSGNSDRCPGCAAEFRTWKAAARLARIEAARG